MTHMPFWYETISFSHTFLGTGQNHENWKALDLLLVGLTKVTGVVIVAARGKNILF